MRRTYCVIVGYQDDPGSYVEHKCRSGKAALALYDCIKRVGHWPSIRYLRVESREAGKDVSRGFIVEAQMMQLEPHACVDGLDQHGIRLYMVADPGHAVEYRAHRKRLVLKAPTYPKLVQLMQHLGWP